MGIDSALSGYEIELIAVQAVPHGSEIVWNGIRIRVFVVW